MNARGTPFATPEFLLLWGISFFAFCSLAVFYGFYSHLESIGIPPAWRGTLLGLEPFTAFVLRLALIPLIDTRNATRLLLTGLLLLMLALLGYRWALDVPTLAAVRILHGAGLVLLVTASITLIVRFIPEDRSAQGFSLFSLSTLLPYAIVPPLAEWLLPHLDSASDIYSGAALLGLPAILLLLHGRARLLATAADRTEPMTRRPSRRDLGEDLRQPAMLQLLGVNLGLYLIHSGVFYFVEPLAVQLGGTDTPGIQGTGSFFMLSTATLILTRLLGGRMLDRLPKLALLRLALAGLALTLLGMAHAPSALWLAVLGIPYGFCFGIGLPLLNALLFLASAPRLRAVNTNLALFMMDAGFFLSPWLGGAFLAAGGPLGHLAALGAGVALMTLVLLLSLRSPVREVPRD